MNSLSTLKILSAKLSELLTDTSCLVCYEEFNLQTKIPMMICMEQHSCCQDCIKYLQKCPMCRVNVNGRNFGRNRMFCSILEQIEKVQEMIKHQSGYENMRRMKLRNGMGEEEIERMEKQMNKSYFKQKKKHTNFQIRTIKTAYPQKKNKVGTNNMLHWA